METDKEEAARCLRIAKNQYGSKNFEAAVRLTKKSIGLHSTVDAQEFLKKAEIGAAGNPSSGGPASKEKEKSNTNASASASSSQQQSTEVREILACGTDYYKVLKVGKKCTEVEVKKSYKKLALKFHPDKNQTSGADEAFKLISKAFTVLSDPQKRAIHDAGGGDPEQRGGGGAGFPSGFSGFQTQNFGASPFGDEVSPEDLFNMFFGGGGVNMANMGGRGATFSFGGAPGFSSATFVGPGFRTRTFDTRGSGRQNQQPQGQPARSGWSVLLQILPLIILFGYTLLSGLLTGETPQYAFHLSPAYSQSRFTAKNQVPYYVDPSAFEPVLKDNYKLSNIESQVEREWLRTLQDSCLYERKTQQAKLDRARGAFGFIGRDEKLYQEALNMKVPSCDKMKRFGEQQKRRKY